MDHWTPILMLRSFQVLIGPSRSWHEPLYIFDKMKHQEGNLKVFLLLKVVNHTTKTNFFSAKVVIAVFTSMEHILVLFATNVLISCKYPKLSNESAGEPNWICCFICLISIKSHNFHSELTMSMLDKLIIETWMFTFKEEICFFIEYC